MRTPCSRLLKKKQDKIKVEDKAKDETYQVNVENVPFPFFIRFANDYAYVRHRLEQGGGARQGPSPRRSPGAVLTAKTGGVWRRSCCAPGPDPGEV